MIIGSCVHCGVVTTNREVGRNVHTVVFVCLPCCKKNGYYFKVGR